MLTVAVAGPVTRAPISEIETMLRERFYCIIITYAFARRFTFEQVRHECSIVEGQTVSPETVADRFSFCIEVCTLALDKNYIADGLIGVLTLLSKSTSAKLVEENLKEGV